MPTTARRVTGARSRRRSAFRDYHIEGEVDSKWQLLCNINGNYQRRRVHTLPCSVLPGPHPPPPPPVNPPVVAPGSVVATTCNASSLAQRWSIAQVAGHSTDVVTIRNTAQTQTGELCLGFDANTSAYGGNGNSVVAHPCGSAPTAWRWSEAVGGESNCQTCTGIVCRAFALTD